EGGACYIPSCSAATAPSHSYRHDDGAYSGTNQGCIVAGPVYRAGAFPPEYEGNLFIGDYANGWIRRVVFGPDGGVVADPIFEEAPGALTVVDLAVGPDGALAYVTNGIPWSGSLEPGAVHRIAYVGAGNQAPLAVAAASPAQGPAPLAVEFSSAGSSDPDAGPSPLSFLWDFGDGTTSIEAEPTHVYLEEGPRTANLTVSDSAAQASATLSIAVGSPPVAEILSPPPGWTYRAGDRIDFQGSGEDPETGTLPASSFSWQVVQVHDVHAHPFLGPLTGVSGGSFTVPTSGHPPEDSHFEIRLTVSDPSGLTGSAVRALVPVATTLVFDSTPSGVPFFLDGQPETTPRVVGSLAGFEHQVEAQPVSTIGGSTFAFECWSDGGTISHAVVAPDGGMNLTAGYAFVPTQSTTLVVPGFLRNAEYSPLFGQAPGHPSDPLGICWGRDMAGPLQAGFEFLLPVPQGAFVAEARLRMLATFEEFGGPIATIRAYDLGGAPAYDPLSDTPLTEWAPLTSTSVTWAPPVFEPGAFHESPDLSPLLQEVVERADWAPGNAFGIVLDGSPTVGLGWRCVTNYLSMVPPLLEVTWALPPPTDGACPSGCGFSTYGLDASPPPTLGLLGTGSPRVGGSVVLTTTGVVAPGAWTLVSPEAATLPIAGGVLLVNPGLALAVPYLPASEGEAAWDLAVPQDPVLVGLPLHFQSVAPDPSEGQGFAFSPGLRVVLCP
ncbi:MAG TPA: PKD domain-containing protein, partial [Planctomycetota bacterium]|nr:PKD domain-containing protein [Planctomycetota bacterium]